MIKKEDEIAMQFHPLFLSHSYLIITFLRDSLCQDVPEETVDLRRAETKTLRRYHQSPGRRLYAADGQNYFSGHDGLDFHKPY